MYDKLSLLTNVIYHHVMACANQSVKNISSAQLFCFVTYCLLAVLCLYFAKVSTQNIQQAIRNKSWLFVH